MKSNFEKLVEARDILAEQAASLLREPALCGGLSRDCGRLQAAVSILDGLLLEFTRDPELDAADRAVAREALRESPIARACGQVRSPVTRRAVPSALAAVCARLECDPMASADEILGRIGVLPMGAEFPAGESAYAKRFGAIDVLLGLADYPDQYLSWCVTERRVRELCALRDGAGLAA